MPIPFTKLLVNHCYQTKSGEVRRVTSITPTGDVVFIAYPSNGGTSAGEEEQTAGALFAETAVEEVPCPT
ncbi:hypothetical protein [Vineibacter terrae]|uniref:Uncharacterized protein n=1 Tax=Vineibacter terrae TaxID=2586908 RepID=A0A5C8PQ48_9HYPH|nr:hypothetical protein [Vineibacter terrae]TXL77570.1 hypothetical protein FHP25_09065 [Vineibacter terrae]HEX2890560.1 hypothetical protein [Vineibacter terrae]